MILTTFRAINLVIFCPKIASELSKRTSKKNHVSPGLLRHTKQFCHYFTLKTNFFAVYVSCIKIDLLSTMIITAYNIRTLVCLLVDWTKCSELIVQLFEAWTWLVCMLATLRLCVTSQLSRAIWKSKKYEGGCIVLIFLKLSVPMFLVEPHSKFPRRCG